MARQNTSPVSHERTTRVDTSNLMTSGRAGVVQCVGYAPINRGDSASGRVTIGFELAEMPRPLLNGVVANVQAWFVPKSAHPQFAGADEFIHSYQEDQIKALGQPDRDAPDFYHIVPPGAAMTALAASQLYMGLGLHVPTGADQNVDLVDALNLVYNFRLAAHSSRLARRPYYQEDNAESVKYPRAFWPSGRFSRTVPDYERALIVGALDLDIIAGQMPLGGIGSIAGQGAAGAITVNETGGGTESGDGWIIGEGRPAANAIAMLEDPENIGWPALYSEMAGQTVSTTLADIDKARTTQAFAKLRTSYAGNDASGFDNDDAIVATLLQGLKVPSEQFKRPWLLDSARVPFGFDERHATDGASLDQSLSQGVAQATLSLNLPNQDNGGIIVFTVEVLPERLDEAMADEWMAINSPSKLPDALRDIQRVEPVDAVYLRRVDARHTTPDGVYGFEPMNDQWNREFTRLGGVFYQADPTNPFNEQRSAIWMSSIVDPAFNDTHFLAPEDFPHDVFADTSAPAFEVVVRHSLSIVGITQMGDMLAENNDDYEAVKNIDGGPVTEPQP